MNETEKIVFFFPWKEISGGPIYLTGLANDLAENDRYTVWYADYEPGLSDDLLHRKNVHKIVYKEPFSFPIKTPVTLITPIYCAPFIPKLHLQSKIIFLNWHNFCTNELIRLWQMTDRDLQLFLKLLYDHHALFFLDRSHWLAQNEWVSQEESFIFPEEYVPVKVDPGNIHAPIECIDKNELHIAVLGRLCPDKIYSIINLLEQMEKLNNNSKKHIHIIGEGTEEDLLYQKKWGNKIQLYMAGTITGEALQKYLSENADILFAMGLSVLEGAKISLPSVIMPHNIHPFELDAYTYVQDSRGYAVGWYDTQIQQMGILTYTLENIIQDIYQKEKKYLLGQAAYNYLKENHMSNIAFFERQLRRSTLTYQKFKQFSATQGRLHMSGIPLFRLRSSFDGSCRWLSLFGYDRFIQYKTVNDQKVIKIFGIPCRWITIHKENGAYRFYIRIPFFKLKR